MEPSPAPDPSEIYRRAEIEGDRRLSMSFVDQAMTGFVAGVTIVFGLVALGVVESLVEPGLGPEAARLGGALAFGIGLVLLVVGRTELFSENFFDPVAAALRRSGKDRWVRLAMLWLTILLLNLLGGAVLVAILTVEGALPDGAPEALMGGAEKIAEKSWTATLARSVLAGALITLLSYLLNAVDTALSRMLLAYLVGFLLALGPFDHVVVSALHLLYGIWNAAEVGYADLVLISGLAALGNLAGGLLLITLTHTAQVDAEQ